MTAGLVVLARSDAAAAAAGEALRSAIEAGRARVFAPAPGPPGEYPDAGPGDLRSVWIIDQATAHESGAVVGDGVEAYAVDSLVQWDEPDDDPANGEVTAMRLAFLVPRPDLSLEEFVSRWREHAAVAKAHQPDFRRYVQHVVTERLTPACGSFAAIGEFGFRRLQAGEDVRRFDSPEGQKVVEGDIARFLAPSGAPSIWMRPA